MSYIFSLMGISFLKPQVLQLHTSNKPSANLCWPMWRGFWHSGQVWSMEAKKRMRYKRVSFWVAL